MARAPTFTEVVTAAVRDIEQNGFDSEERITRWMAAIRRAAFESMVPMETLTKTLNASLAAIYKRLVEREGLLKLNPGVSRFTLMQVQPRLRAELDRRIMASANLIKLNREKAINDTLQRFSGWSTSIPAGGSRVTDTVETKTDIRKSLASLPYRERVVGIDQGAKLFSSLSSILASDGGAIAFIWRSHWRQQNYDYRVTHKERDGKVYAIRNNWAMAKGLMNKGDGYTDEMTAPAEEVFCRCRAQYLFSLRDLPDVMLTQKGKDELIRVRNS